MSVFIDTLAERIQDSVTNADATAEDWLAAVRQIFGSVDPRIVGTQLKLDEVTLVYSDNDDQSYRQPLADLADARTQIHPESGEDLELVGAVAQPKGPDEWRGAALAKEIHDCLTDREDDRSLAAAEFVRENKFDDPVWFRINKLLDEFDKVAAGDYD